MEKPRRQAVIGADLIIQGDVRNGDKVDVLGLIEGSLSARHVAVRQGGRVYGTLIADEAEIDGEVQGSVLVRQLIQIGSSGSVRGDVRYGRIAMQPGAELSAEMRNVPPEIAGDLNIAVKRGGQALVTTEDLTAIDPDSPAQALVFAVSAPRSGYVAYVSAAATPLQRFTQAELAGNQIVFVHDGSVGAAASFEVTVTDDAGGSSGKPQRVHVAVF